MWSNGDGAAGIDELVAQFARAPSEEGPATSGPLVASYPLQDAGGDAVALCVAVKAGGWIRTGCRRAAARPGTMPIRTGGTWFLSFCSVVADPIILADIARRLRDGEAIGGEEPSSSLCSMQKRTRGA